MNQKRTANTIKYSAFQEFNHLPYFRNIPRDGRIALLNAIYDDKNNDWVLLLPVGPDKLQRMMGGEPIVSCYMGFRPANPLKDFEIPLGTFVVQHLSFQGVLGPLLAFENDIHNCSAVLEKYILISVRDKAQRSGIELLLTTELEYLISSIRSIYDLLQQLSKNATARVVKMDEPNKPIIAQLPDSFAKIVLDGDQPRSLEQIQAKFHLPEPLATFYASETEYFRWLRELRVAIEHHGQTIRTIFDLDEGAAVSIRDKPWIDLSIWQEPNYIKNGHLGSLHALFFFMVDRIFKMTTNYVEAYTKNVNVLPNAIEPGMKLFIRNYFSHHLVNIQEVLKSPWERLEP